MSRSKTMPKNLFRFLAMDGRYSVHKSFRAALLAAMKARNEFGLTIEEEESYPTCKVGYPIAKVWEGNEGVTYASESIEDDQLALVKALFKGKTQIAQGEPRVCGGN